MILTDREWLRAMTFALVVGGVLGATNTGALLVNGWPLTHALVGAITFTTTIALVVHGVVRTLLDRATDPTPTDSTETPTDSDPSDT